MKKYVIVGAGMRGYYMYGKRISAEEYKEDASIEGIYDINPVRAREFAKDCGGFPVYDNFDRMLEEVKPDYVIVTTVDCYHHEYIIKALEAGCDVISEKPMTIDEEKCNAILEAEKRTGKRVQVTFNMRFMPYMQKVKALVKSGIIGRVLSVDLEWHLDTKHGADYFRRWHRNIEKSGSLLLHKSTHHFDIINWWLDSYPEEVSAFGTRNFYGPTRKERGTRCLTCQYKDTCEYYWNIEDGGDPFYKRFYYEAEQEDGYIRDSCVFDESINIYDSMAVSVKYQSGALLSYSLIAHSPYEGWKATISGEKGRLEVGEIYTGHGSEDPCNYIKFYNREGELITYRIPKLKGSHGGGDDKLIRMLVKEETKDELGVLATSMDGAMSLLIGAAANISIKNKEVVSIENLLKCQ
ncbi:putative dehydrogenase [Anaerotaenia torta]|uniref:Gfo/Idh/MocA family oxidoreductase n=1 Tax=Anaerotaenia torta TaxID=433293 RepID=UPI003D1F915C